MNELEKSNGPIWQIWKDLLSEQDQAVITKAEYDSRGATLWNSRSLGKNPALLIIDMQNLLVGRNVPILEAISDHRTAMGSIAWAALEFMIPLVQKVRDAGLPVIFTRVLPQGPNPDDSALQIVESLSPRQEETVIDKAYASAFYGTDLVTQLVQRQIDTLIVIGNSTSGCVRATVVDARQYGFQALIPVECVFDRIEASHKVSLLDMWLKYGNLMTTQETIQYLEQVTG